MIQQQQRDDDDETDADTDGLAKAGETSTTMGDCVVGKVQKRNIHQPYYDTNDNDDKNNYYHNRRGGRIQCPSHEFSFLLRVKNGANQQFWNRGMEIEYLLQKTGFFWLLQQQWSSEGGRGNKDDDEEDLLLVGAIVGESSISVGEYRKQKHRRSATAAQHLLLTVTMDWINDMAKVKDDPIALFHILYKNPALCAL